MAGGAIMEFRETTPADKWRCLRYLHGKAMQKRGMSELKKTVRKMMIAADY